MPKDSNISEEDYLDSLLRSVSAKKEEEFDIDKELGLTDEFDSDFDAEFEAQLEAELAMDNAPKQVEISGKVEENKLAESNSVFSDDESEEEPASELDSFDEFAESQNTDNKKEDTAINQEINTAQEEASVFNDVINNNYDSVADKSVNFEADDITEGLENFMNKNAADEKAKQKEQLKAEKARIKANKKAAREAAKIAKIAAKAEAAKAKADAVKVKAVGLAGAADISSKTSNDYVNTFADMFSDASSDDEYPLGNGRKTAEEKTIDNSVEEELAGLGLDGLFGDVPEEDTESNEYQDLDVLEAPEEDEEEEQGEEAKEEKPKKEKKKKEKKQKKPAKKKVPKPKKEKKKKEKKPKEPDEIIPIPKALLIFGLSFVVLLVAATTIGGKYNYYNKCMEKAVTYYVNKDYKSAYKQLAGLNIKDSDKFFYEQVKVVMTVENNYDLFKSQMRLGMYREALDSLLKGVANFDLYQNEARDWDAFDDLEISLRRIVDALNKYYGITESQAREINLIESQREYSIKVAELALNVNFNKEEPFADETTTPPVETTTEESQTTMENDENDSNN